MSSASENHNVTEIANEEVVQLAKLLKLDEFSVAKNTANCVVLRAESFFYKCHKIDISDPKSSFNLIVWAAFAHEYRLMGLEWNFFTLSDDALGFYCVEQREQLQLLNENCMSPQEMLNKTAVIRDRVQKRLEIPRLSYQVRSTGLFDMFFDKIILLRDVDFHYDDYAMYGNKVIPLGNSNWCLVLLKSGKWVKEVLSHAVPVSLSYGDFYFERYKLNLQTTPLERLYELTPKWWLYPQSCGNLLKIRQYCASELDKMYKTNAKILTTKQETPVKIGQDYSKNSRLSLKASPSALVEQTNKFLDGAGQSDK